MDSGKLKKVFKTQINKIRNEGIKQADIDQYFDFIKQGIKDDLKDGFKEKIARNLTLGIGMYAAEYPKYLILNNEKEGWKFITRYLLWQQHILKKLFMYKEVTSRSAGCIIGLSLLWDLPDLAKLSRE